jgi:hypothetical protein
MPPIRLTDSELDAVMNAARPLQPRDRDAFLRDVANELAAVPVLGDGAVHRAIAVVQRRHWDPPDLSRTARQGSTRERGEGGPPDAVMPRAARREA